MSKGYFSEYRLFIKNKKKSYFLYSVKHARAARHARADKTLPPHSRMRRENCRCTRACAVRDCRRTRPCAVKHRRRTRTPFFVLVECFSGQKVWSAVSVGFFGQKQRENLPSISSFKHFNKLLTDGSSELHHLYFASLNRLYW